jgi:hypothetical protein
MGFRIKTGFGAKDSKQKRDSDFDEPSLARHDTVMKVDVQADKMGFGAKTGFGFPRTGPSPARHYASGYPWPQ